MSGGSNHFAPYTPLPGDIGLTSIVGHVGRLINVGQWLNAVDLHPRTWFDDDLYRYEHAFVYVGDVYDEGPSQIVEAEPGGASAAPLSKYAGRDVLYLRCPDAHRDGVAAAALSLRRVPYSYLDYLSLVAHRLHIPAPHLKAFIRDGGHLICSQLADRAAMLGGWQIFDDGRWEGDVVPADLARLAREQAAARARAGAS